MLLEAIYYISSLCTGVLLKITFGIKNFATENSIKTIDLKKNKMLVLGSGMNEIYLGEYMLRNGKH